MRRRHFIFLLSGIFILDSAPACPSDEANDFFRSKMMELYGGSSHSCPASDFPLMKCGTPLTIALNAFTVWNQDTDLNLLLDRPDDLPDTLGGENILVHYTTLGNDAPYQVDVDTDPPDGVPDYINRTVEIFEYVWDYQINNLGYNIPPADYGRGGDDRYDVYVRNLGPGYFGFAVPEDIVDGYRANSYIEIENDFAGSRFEYEPIRGLEASAAHEFFHAVQFGYDVFEFDYENPDDPDSYKPWWLEASSNWMEDVIYDDVNDYLVYLPFFYGYPWMGLGTFSFDYGDPRAYHPYASCVWPVYLSERFNVDIVREIWEGCGSVGGYNTLSATNSALQPETELSKAFLEFSVWNFHTGAFADTVEFYSEGNLFPGMDTTFYIHDLTADSVDIGNLPRPPEHLGANFIVIMSGQDSGGVALDFDGDDMYDSEWDVAMLGYEPFESEWDDIFVDPNSGEGRGEWRGWNYYHDVVIIPTVSGIVPLYDQYPYQGWVAYDPSLVRDTTVSVWPGDDITPIKFSIVSVYPNPFNPSTTISYSLPEEAELTICIYNLLGQRVATLLDSFQQAGRHSLTWDASAFPSGVYFAGLKAGGRTETVKMVLLK